MSLKPPCINEDNYNTILEELKNRITLYTPEWIPGEYDPGTALLQIASHMLQDIAKRLNRFPLKQFLTFLETLGINQIPPAPARVPLTFFLAEGTKEHLLIKKGTTAVYEEISFTTEKNLLITPSTLTDFYMNDPEEDKIYQTPAGFMDTEHELSARECFPGKNIQTHTLYIGHKELFNLNKTVQFKLSPGFLKFPGLTWEYWGEKKNINPITKGESMILGWHPLCNKNNENKLLIDPEDGRPLLTKESTGEILEKEENNIKSRWIRCNTTLEETGKILEKIYLQKPPSHISDEGMMPDLAFFRKLALDMGTVEDIKSFFPFGPIPRVSHIFYMACQEAFSKIEADIQIHFTMEKPGIPAEGVELTIHWEYWNGKTWKYIPDLSFLPDEANSEKRNFYHLDADGTLKFKGPEDIKPISINKEQNFWIRARIASGDFDGAIVEIPPTYEERVIGTDQYGNNITMPIMVNSGSRLQEEPNPPVIKTIRINYGTIDLLPQNCFSVNNLTTCDHIEKILKTESEGIIPFVKMNEIHQTLYLGFDKQLINGPIRLFFDLEQKFISPEDFPEIHWFYSTGENSWKDLNAIDNTANITRSGIVELFLPEDFKESPCFDKYRYWIKLVDVKDKLKSIDDDSSQESRTVIKGIYLNTVYAVQQETTREEILGSSNGNSNQKFNFQHPPLIDEEIWINEGTSLTEADLELLHEQKGTDFVTQKKDSLGRVLSTWIKWEPVDDFFYSDQSERHYTIDRITGEISFGNGTRGKIPPTGDNNIRSTYTFGGGSKGNLKKGSIQDLQTTIPYIEGVYNFLPADGGADTEEISLVMERGPEQIKHRNRAVTVEDFERLTKNLSTEIARTKCLLEEGQVKVIIIPQLSEEKPVPPLMLLDQIKQELLKRCTALLKPTNLYVIPPSYKEVIVKAEIFPTSSDLVVPLSQEINEKLKSFLHPLSGGSEGKGWDFGRDVHLSDIYSFIENIDGVDHIGSLKLSIPETENLDPIPVMNFETVCSGTHIIIMKTGE